MHREVAESRLHRLRRCLRPGPVARLTTAVFLIGLSLQPLWDSAPWSVAQAQPATAETVTPDRRRDNPIAIENRRPGTTRWQSAALQRNRIPRSNPPAAAPRSPGALPTTPATWEDNPISGYADRTSVNHGEDIDFKIRTSLPSYDIEVYRMGWYDGAGARLVAFVQGLEGVDQPIPTPDPATGLVEANWQTSYTLQTGTDWVTGVYLAKLVASDGSTAYIIFVVRDDASDADVLYQIPTTTYQAYNDWGGEGLYTSQTMPGGLAYKASYDRPYNTGGGAGWFFNGDYNMIRFLEASGYDIAYATSEDLQSNPHIMDTHRVFLSNWHDEYWSRTMRERLVAIRDAGRSIAFFGGNTMYWQIRYEPSSSGVPNRVIVCYRDETLDPMTSVDPSLATVRWRDYPLDRPENEVLGSMFTAQLEWNNRAPWIVR